MVKIGYTLSSEEHRPNDLVRYTRRAEELGFSFASISDHFHPWVDAQGHSPFVWSVLGGIAQATSSIQLITGVTCPTIRIHPAIIAHAAATVADMMSGRFVLGIGTGENLNEHILGDRWPEYEVRAEMLEESVEVMRLLWQGGYQSHHGKYYTVENARLYTLPDELPPIVIAAGGTKSAELAARIGDGLMNTSPDEEVIKAFEEGGGASLPKYGKISMCWAESEAEARKTAFEQWPNAAIKGELSRELPLPMHFEQAAQMVTEDDVAESIICGNNPQKVLDMIEKYVNIGFDHIFIHQIGPDQEGFFNFYQQSLLPELDVVETA